jgi:diguanylate cyclase
MMLMLSHTALPRPVASDTVGMVERTHRLRLARQLLGAIGIGTVLYGVGAGPMTWLLLVGCTFAWPLLARERAFRAHEPRAAELRSLLVDSALGGMWIALMRFDLLPSLLLTVLLACDTTIAGGLRLALRGLVVQLAACVLTLAVHGFAFAPDTRMPEILASIPLLLYPLALAITLHAQTRRLSDLPNLVPPTSPLGDNGDSLPPA